MSKYLAPAFVLFFIATAGFVGYKLVRAQTHTQSVSATTVAAVAAAPVVPVAVSVPAVPPSVVPPVTHVQAPAQVHGIYVTGWSAGTTKNLARIYTLLNTTPINAVVIDIKDATGKLSYEPLDPTLVADDVGTKRIPDLAVLIKTLHEKGIYVIGRVAVFQDPYYVTLHPEDSFMDSATNEPWRDPKGIAWIDPSNQDFWHYITAISEDAYAQGFDEINLDYVRYPSDGDLSVINRPATPVDREAVIDSFFSYIDQQLRQTDHIPVSADIFGETVTATDDMGIGQKFEDIASHVDYVCPMVYPSHFAAGSYGVKNPAADPYTIIHRALSDGIAKATAADISLDKIRPWFQDFNLGAVYTASMVEAQTTAATELHIDSWLYWDPRNVYTQAALK